MRIRSLSRVLALAGAIVATGALSTAPTLADGPLKVHLQLGDRCLGGHKPTDQPVKIKLLRHDGTAIETKHDDTTSLDWAVCFHHVPVAGNKLQMVNGTFERTATVPDLTFHVNRVASIVSGQGPAGKGLEIGYLDCGPRLVCYVYSAIPVNVNSHGRFHKDVSPPYDIDGADEVDVFYENAREDLFSRAIFAPYLQVTKPNRIRLSCMPRGTTTVRLLSSAGSLRATKSFHATRDCSDFSGSFRKDGHDVNVHTGDRVVSDFATDGKLVWPVMSVDGQVNTLLGRCVEDSPWTVFVTHGTSTSTYSGMTDADGHFSIDATPWSFVAGDVLELVCETDRGDRVRMVRTLQLI